MHGATFLSTEKSPNLSNPIRAEFVNIVVRGRPWLVIGIQRKQHSTDVIGEHVDDKPFLSPGSNEISRPLRAINLLPFLTTIKLNTYV